MEKGVKQHILSLLDTGHRHDEMKKMLACSYCGDRFKKAEKEYNRLRFALPDKFKRKEPEDIDSPAMLEKEQALEDRIKNDSLYKKHLRTLWKGMPSDKEKEIKKFWGGFYEKHTGDWIKKTWN